MHDSIQYLYIRVLNQLNLLFVIRDFVQRMLLVVSYLYFTYLYVYSISLSLLTILKPVY